MREAASAEHDDRSNALTARPPKARCWTRSDEWLRSLRLADSAPPATLSIEKRFLDEIDINTIINEFASKNVIRNF
jgi:hypothetical protein